MVDNVVTQHKHFISRADLRTFFGPEEKEEFSEWFEELIDKLDMQLLSGPHVVYVDRPGLRGWTGVCIIETSHIAIHVWDEGEIILAQLDVYTCGGMDRDAIVDHIDRFEPYRVEFMILDREYGLDELEAGTIFFEDEENDDYNG